MAQVLNNYAEQLEKAEMPAGKKKVLKTALKLFASNGFHATTTAQIARQAGVSEGTIYKYFDSKNDLFTNLLHPILNEIKDNFFGQVKNFASLGELVQFIVTNRLHFIDVNFDFIKLLFQEVLTNQITGPVYADLVTGPTGVITQLTEIQGKFSEINQSLSPFQMLRIFIGPILVYSLQNKLFQIPGSDDDIELIQKQIIANLTLK